MDDPEDQENAKNICKHYLKGECRFRHNCKFLHPGDHAKTEAEPRELEDQEPAVPQPVQRKGWPRREKTEWAHILLVPPACIADELELVPRLIGHAGENTTNIWLLTNAKVRIRGRGSGHLEVDHKKEAPVNLMMAISVTKGW